MASYHSDRTYDGGHAAFNQYLNSCATEPYPRPPAQIPAYANHFFMNPLLAPDRLPATQSVDQRINNMIQGSSQSQSISSPYSVLHGANFNVNTMNFILPPACYPPSAPNARPDSFASAPPIDHSSRHRDHSTSHRIEKPKSKHGKSKAVKTEQQQKEEADTSEAIIRNIELGLRMKGHPVVNGRVCLVKPNEEPVQVQNKNVAVQLTAPASISNVVPQHERRRVHIFKGAMYDQILACYGGRLPAGSLVGKHEYFGHLVVIPIVDGDNTLEPLLFQIQHGRAARAAMTVQRQGGVPEPSNLMSTSTVPPAAPNEPESDDYRHFFARYVNDNAYELEKA